MNRIQNQRGSALLLTTIITLAVIAISGAFISHAMIRAKKSSDTLFGSQAMTAAEAGAAMYVQKLNMNKWKTSNPLPTSNYLQGTLGSSLAASTNNNAASLFVNQTVFQVWLENLGSNGLDDNGANGIDETAEGNYYRIWSVGYAGGRWDSTNKKYIGGTSRTLEVVLTGSSGGAFWNAIFAGNSSGDTTYSMNFAGTGGSKDIVYGDIYSGGKINLAGDSLIRNESNTGAGSVTSTGTFSTTTTASPPSASTDTQPNLDIAGMNYDLKAANWLSPTSPYYDPNFVNVTSKLGSSGSAGTIIPTGRQSDMGTAAKQITDTNDPSHIFRLDPTTSVGVTQPRVQGYSGMNPDKHNYFIEDPSKTADGGGSAASPWGTSDTSNPGLRVEVLPSGNNKIYYIDGNLWASNGPAYTFQWLNSTGADMRITIVVKGNVYLTDNLIYDRIAQTAGRQDALAIIAIKDSTQGNISAADVTNPANSAMSYYNATATLTQAHDAARDYNKLHGSGNIFYGDPGGGTTERFESFMYAENNFYDNNLGASGTNLTNIYGNMTAGNQVDITRQSSVYKPMQVTFDNRIKNGTVSLPGLPGNPSSAGSSWTVASWRQVASHPTASGSFNFTIPGTPTTVP